MNYDEIDIEKNLKELIFVLVLVLILTVFLEFVKHQLREVKRVIEEHKENQKI